MQTGGRGIGFGLGLIPVILIPLVSYGLMAWILYKFYGALMRDELRNIKDALRERGRTFKLSGKMCPGFLAPVQHLQLL
jgi:hypothetical protein